MTDWIESELQNIDIGDKRLKSFHESLGNSIPNSFCNRKEVQACYRFFDNDLVHSSSILEPTLELPTTRGTIHYRKNGSAHIVPARPNQRS